MRKLKAILITLSLTIGLAPVASASFIQGFESEDGNASFDEELLFNSYNSLGDVIAGNRSSGSFSPVDLSAAYSISGIAANNDGYHVVFESEDGNLGAGEELLINSYNTLEDLIAGNRSSGGFAPVDLVAGYSISGFAADNEGFHLVFEADDGNLSFDEELLYNSYSTFDDVIAGTRNAGQFSPIDLVSSFSIRGFAALSQPVITTPVPAPGTLVFLIVGLLTLTYKSFTSRIKCRALKVLA